MNETGPGAIHSVTQFPSSRTPDSDDPIAGEPDRRTAAANSSHSPKQRDAFLDNAKYLTIILVAVGHAWEPFLSDSRTATALYMVVYTFHMPAFIIISGCLSRGFEMRPHQIRRLITGVLVPYVIFEVAYTLFVRWQGGDPDKAISLLDPWFLTWFLIALFIWRLTAPLWKNLRHPLPLALTIAMLASLSPSTGDDLDLQRVLQFLPFFVIGLSLEPEHLRFRRRHAILAGPLFGCAAVVAYWMAPRMNYAWFYHNDSAQELHAPWWAGPVMQLSLFGCSLTLTACFFVLIPRRRTWYTTLGTRTLYGYLLHGFLVKGAAYWGWYDHDWVRRPAGEITVTVITAAAVTLLCTPPVRRLLHFVVEPGTAWAFTTDPATKEPAERPAVQEPTPVEDV